jgi:nucleolar MIF4G domain-containing protein 1
VSLATRYIPPHLRKNDDEPESEAILKLKKQLKGLLNRCVLFPLSFPLSECDVLFRMSEQNLVSIIDGIEELYRNNRRHGAWLSG